MLLLFSPRLNPERECVRTTLERVSKISSQDPSNERGEDGGGHSRPPAPKEYSACNLLEKEHVPKISCSC
jgi:hypothetical protein